MELVEERENILTSHQKIEQKSWYSEQVSKQMKDIEVDMKLFVMKPLSARWIISAYEHLRNEGGIVRGGLVEGGICEAVDKPESASESEDDPFADIDEQ